MNEWSYKGYISGSVTTDQQPQTKAYRQNWEENWNHMRGKTNFKNTMNCYTTRDYNKQAVYAEQQQYFNDNVKIPSNYFSKRKKYGASDPRFKRLINSEMRNEPCFESEQDKISPSSKKSQLLNDRINEDSMLPDKMISYLKTPNDSSMYSCDNSKKFGSAQENCERNLSEVVTRDVGFKNSSYASDNLPDESYRDSDKIRITSKTNLKKSASDCTLHLKNNYGNDLEDENIHRIRQHPSATRITKIHHWMKDSKMPAEKRRSVITVIGQTQTKSFSKILHEINQRRKLAKELDKHALCEAIMESTENQCKVKNLIAKVDFLLPDGKIIYSTEKVYMCKDNDKCLEKDVGEYEYKNLDYLENSEKLRRRCEMIPERDSSISQVGKRSKTKRSYRKLGMSIKEKNYLRDKVRSFYLRSSSTLFWSFLVLLLLTLCAGAFCYAFKPSYHFILPEFLRPRGKAWYKKFWS